MPSNPLPRRPPLPPGSPAGGPGVPSPEPGTPEPQPIARSVRPGVSRKKWLVAAGLLLGGSGGAGVLMLTPLVEPDPTVCEFPVPRENETATKLFQEAKQLIREGKWEEARVKLVEVQQLAPEMAAVRDYLERAEKEVPNQQHLVAAQAALSANQLSKAKAELDLIAQDTQQYEQVNILKRALRDAADLRSREAVALYGKGQRHEARLIAEDILGAFPEHRNAQAIPPARESRPPEPELPSTYFMRGDLNGAVELSRGCASASLSCKKELKALTEFRTLYNKGGKKQLGTQDLQRMLALDKQLAGPGNTSTLAQELITSSRSKAKELYLMGYALKDAEPTKAAAKFREAQALTLPEDEVHQRAINWLGRLKR